MAQDHHHDDHHQDDSHWRAWADQLDLEGQLFVTFVTDTATKVRTLRGHEAPPIQRVLDIGSGPGVGTCELARIYPDANVVALDSSPPMLRRALERASALGLASRVSTQVANLPDGIPGTGPADMILGVDGAAPRHRRGRRAHRSAR